MEQEALAEQFRRFLGFRLLGIDETVAPDGL